MLTTYCLTRPEGMIESADILFNNNSIIPNSNIAKEVLERVECGEYVNSDSFKSRYGSLLPKERLSTGVKAFFNLLQHQSTPLNMDEMGENLSFYLCRVSDGIIYLPEPTFFDFDFCGGDAYSVDLDKRYDSVAFCLADLSDLVKEVNNVSIKQ